MMDRETNDLLARLYLSEKNLSHIEPREFVEWAALELERGNDRDSVRRLGGMTGSDDLSKIGQQFRDCIADLGWEIPKNKAVMKRHAESTLQSIVDGTIEPYSIGLNVSSGCIRMLNENVLELYSMVDIGTKVIVT